MNCLRPSRLRCAAALVGLAALWPGSLGAARAAPDLDGDSIPNIVDLDVDSDGIPNALDDNIDGGFAKMGPYLGTYIGDHVDNRNAAEWDIDGDGRNDDWLGEDDIDGDGYDDDDAAEMDLDGDDRFIGSTEEGDRAGPGRSDGEGEDDNKDGGGAAADGSRDPSGKQTLRQELTARPAAPGEAMARAHIHLRDSGSVVFAVAIAHGWAGTYGVRVGEVARGVITIAAGESAGQLAFDTHPDEPGEGLLDFNPAGLSVRIFRGAEEWFAGPVPTPRAVGEGARGWAAEFRGSLAAAPEAAGEMELGVSHAGEVALVLAVRHVAAAAYDVRIGGVIRGQMAILPGAERVSTLLTFVADPLRRGEARLDFEAAHQEVAIEKGGVVYLSGMSPGPPSGP